MNVWNEDAIKIIGEVRAALIHQKFIGYMPIEMDEAIEKLTKIMRDKWTQEAEHSNTLKMNCN